MNKFLNYVDGQLTVDTFRSPYASVTDFDDIVTSAANESEQRLACSLDGTEVEKLESGYFNGSATSEIIDAIYDLVK